MNVNTSDSMQQAKAWTATELDLIITKDDLKIAPYRWPKPEGRVGCRWYGQLRHGELRLIGRDCPRPKHHVAAQPSGLADDRRSQATDVGGSARIDGENDVVGWLDTTSPPSARHRTPSPDSRRRRPNRICVRDGNPTGARRRYPGGSTRSATARRRIAATRPRSWQELGRHPVYSTRPCPDGSSMGSSDFGVGHLGRPTRL